MKRMRRFRDLPIRQKLTRTTVLTSGTALLLASVAFVAYELVTFRHSMVQQLATQADIVGSNSAAALLFNDRAAVAKTLEALRAEPHVVAAGVYTREGQSFATYVREGGGYDAQLENQLATAERYRFEGDRLLVRKDIVVDKERVGSVRLLSDLDEMWARLQRYIGIVALVFVASIAAAFPILSRLQQMIAGPIMHLVEKARIVSEEKDYSVRATPTSEDELGLLVRAFNDMLSQIEQRDAELGKARDDAQAANRAKDEFLAVVSHELRTPLTPVLAWSRMLRGGQLDAAATDRALTIIERNVRSQAQLIEDLLDVSRIITGKLRLDVQPVEIVPVVEAVIDSVRATAEVKNVRLQMIVDPDAGVVAGDAERLKQVLWNLLSNAIKFTPKGGRVQVIVQRVNSHLEIAVSDTGKGIAPEFLPYVFERFRQADTSSTRSHGGLGLGLAIVRHLVELHGGHVRAESDGDGKGATFAVELPSALLRPAVGPERTHPTVDRTTTFPTALTLSGLRILAVDDEPDTLETIRAILEQSGAEVRGACSAAEALAILDVWAADLLVSDIGMPGEDGYELIRKVRARSPESGGRIPALALTAYARVEDRLRVLSAGFQMHVPKPIEPAELATVAANLAQWTAKEHGLDPTRTKVGGLF